MGDIKYFLIGFLFLSKFADVLSQTGCIKSYTGIAVDGNDIANVQGTSSSCCQACQKQTGCTAYTWTNSNGGTCYLKNGTEPLFLYDGGFTGIMGPDTNHTYTLHKNYTAANFFDNFYFNSLGNFGFSQFTNETEAQSLGLVNTTSGKVYLGVDHMNTLSTNLTQGRPSVRLDSLQRYSSGLFILSIDHIPVGPGTWPAFWMDGTGEIDVLESYNIFTNNHITLHSNSDCLFHLTDSKYFNGSWYGSDTNTSYFDCYGGAKGSTDLFKGCHIMTRNGTFNDPVNQAGGAVYVMHWVRDKFIKIWDFVKPNIPDDIVKENPNPNPDLWGMPDAYFRFNDLCTPDHFVNQTLIFDTSFCGGPLNDFNGNYTQCKEHVAAHPFQYTDTYFLINYLKVFCVPGEACEKDTP